MAPRTQSFNSPRSRAGSRVAACLRRRDPRLVLARWSAARWALLSRVTPASSSRRRHTQGIDDVNHIIGGCD